MAKEDSDKKIDEEIEEGFIEGNIPLDINSYADIFSSFDSRHFSKKALSIDFLDECKRATRDKGDIGLEVVISVPKKNRVLSDEFKIKKRLKEHFRKHFIEKEREIKKIKIDGAKWIFLGIFAVAIAVLIKTFEKVHTFDPLIEPLLIIPGWFGIWEGLGKIFITARDRKPDYDFYRKMKTCNILFKDK